MKDVMLAGGGPAVSRFIFGTAKLFNVGLRHRRVRLLEAAIDHGFTHFDTAPSYAFGTVETDLGLALMGRPQIGVTTKVGLYPPGGAGQADPAVLLRKAAGRLLPGLSRPRVDWNVARARESLRSSLKRLRRERVELFLLHEPEIEQIAAEEWLRWLEDERAAGRVGRFGLAGVVPRLAPLVGMGSPLADLLQAGDSLDGHETDRLTALGRTPQITYGYATAALRQGRIDMAAVLAGAAARNPNGAIIVATGRVDRLRQWASFVG